MKKRDLFIVIVVLAFGIVYNYIDSGEIQFYEGCNINTRGLRDRSHLNTFQREELRYGTQDIDTIDILNTAGSIEILGMQPEVSENEIRVLPEIHVYHRDRTAAQEYERDIKIFANADGNRLKLSVKPSSDDFPYTRVRVLFKVSVPAGTPLAMELWNRYGNVDVTGIESGSKPLKIDNRHGNILAKRIKGSLTLRHKHGKVTVREISDTLDLYSQHSRISIDRIGTLKLKGTHSKVYIDGVEKSSLVESLNYATLKIENAGGLVFSGRHTRINAAHISQGVEIDNSHSGIYLEDISGNLKLKGKHCRIQLHRIRSDKVSIYNRYDYINIEDIIANQLDIELGNGNLDIFVRDIKERLSIKNRHSRIRLTYPEEMNPSFSIDLNHGKIKNSTGTSFEMTTRKQRVQLNRAASLPEIKIDSYYGDLYLKNGELPALETAPPVKSADAPVKVEPEEFTPPEEN